MEGIAGGKAWVGDGSGSVCDLAEIETDILQCVNCVCTAMGLSSKTARQKAVMRTRAREAHVPLGNSWESASQAQVA